MGLLLLPYDVERLLMAPEQLASRMPPAGVPAFVATVLASWVLGLALLAARRRLP